MSDTDSSSECRIRVRNRNGTRIRRNRDRPAGTRTTPSGARVAGEEIRQHDEDDLPEILSPREDACKPVPMTPAELALYHPGSKKDAKWKDGILEFADGFIVCAGVVKPREYPNVKGIDLVRWFTDTYMMQKAKREKAHKKMMQTRENPLQIPNPRIAISVRGRKFITQPTFLTLPAEVRNLIYAHAIPSGRILIRKSHPGREFAALKAAWNPENRPVFMPSCRLSHLLDNEDIDDGLEISNALLLTNKQIGEEAKPVLYGQIVFCFDSMKTVDLFLKKSSKTAEQIRKLELYNAGWRDSGRGWNFNLKFKHDRRWRMICRCIAEAMPALESLKLEIVVYQDNPVLQAEDEWYQTLMTLVSKKRLELVMVSVSCKAADEDNVVEIASQLEDTMMTEHGKHTRDEKAANLAIKRYYEAEAAAQAAELERLALLPPVQAKRVLTIVLPDKDNSGSSANPQGGERKYYTSNTAGYARETPYGGWPEGPWQ